MCVCEDYDVQTAVILFERRDSRAHDNYLVSLLVQIYKTF